MDKTSQTSVESRRSFLKKAAYVAPAVMALGALSAPLSAQASLIYNQKTVLNEAGESARVTEHYDNVDNFTYDGTFTPNGGETSEFTRDEIVKAKNNYLQIFFDFVFGRGPRGA